MFHRGPIKKGNILSFEDSYKQTQFVAGLIISVCSLSLFWELNKEEFSSKTLSAIRIGFLLIFIVFSINIYVIHSISNHISNVYSLVSGANRNQQNEMVQMEEAYDYHIKERGHMTNTIKLFRFSLAVLLIAVCLIIISKHTILNMSSTIFLVIVTALTIMGIYTTN